MITLAELRLYLGVEGADENRELELLIPLAVDVLEADLRYTFEPATSIDYIAGSGTDTLYLVHMPSADPTQVLERAAVGDAGDPLVVTTDWVRRSNRLLRVGGVWTSGAEYQVTYASGYAEVPGHIKMATLRVAAVLYRLRGKDGTKNEAISGYSYTKYDEIREVLDQLEHRQVFA